MKNAALARLSSLFLVLLLAGCGSSGGSDSNETDPGSSGDDTCAVTEQNTFVVSTMADEYLWNSGLPAVVDVSAYDSPEATLVALRNEADHWSYIQDSTAYDNYFQSGEVLRYGFLYSYADNNTAFQVYNVETNSPMEAAGLLRGDKITAIGGYTVAQIIGDGEIADLAFGESNDSTPVLFTFLRDGTEQNLTVSKGSYTVDTVQTYQVLERPNGSKVGYLLFNAFLSTSYDRLKTAFAHFASEGVDELVVDLRYNGGGLVSTATHLGSLIDRDLSARIFAKVVDNDPATASAAYFGYTEENSLDLQRVYFLTKGNTCSASELVINGLKPYTEVVTIGADTCGKPYGMLPYEFCDKTLSLITYKFANANDESYENGGIAPTCQAEDDPSYPLGDENEASMAAALYYMENQECHSATADGGRERRNINPERLPETTPGFPGLI